MSEPLDYPRDVPTGPHTAVLPDPGPNGYAPLPQQPYGYQPTGPVPAQNYQPKPNRLNKVAAVVGIAAGALVIVAVLFGGGFYLGRETAPTPPVTTAPTAGGFQQGGPLIIPMPRGGMQGPGPNIEIPNGPTIQLPNLFPGLPMTPQGPGGQTPGQPPR